MKQSKPEYYKWSIKSQSLFPDWEYTLWDKSMIVNLIHQYNNVFPGLLNLFNCAPTFSYQSDLARYIILYDVGGIYFDTDYEILKNFEFVINTDDKTEFICVSAVDTYNKLECMTFGLKNNIQTSLVGVIKQYKFYSDLINENINKGPYNKQIHKSKECFTRDRGLKIYNNIFSKYYKNLPTVRVLPTQLFFKQLIGNSEKRKIVSPDEYISDNMSTYGLDHPGESWLKHKKLIDAIDISYGHMKDYWQIILIILFIAVVVLVAILIRNLYKSKKTDKKYNSKIRHLRDLRDDYNILVDEFNDLL
jgi:hypothetical protein